MILLAVETSCDETSVAIIRNGKVLSTIVSSQIKLHAEYGGVVPELAAREHLANLIPVANAAMTAAEVQSDQVDAIAATQGPGLPGALVVGLKAAQGMAFALNKPFFGINHHEAHLYSPWITGSPPVADFDSFQPNISLIVSGGHTMLIHVESELKHHVLGSTIDDAAGECFDKVAKLIGLPYPGGPEIDRLASAGNPKAYDFPRPMLRDASDDFSFSGLKTSVRYFIRDNPAVLDSLQKLQDLCASVQEAIVEVLVTKTVRAANRLQVKCVTASGGVTCNRALRSALETACKRKHLTLRLAEKSLCTDNAAMIGVLAERKLLHSSTPTSLDSEIMPGWALA
ncbi:tRNA (adenosine(37)-N6)-threonylcarbamoyltransferase complex transferase subunit TsaD [Pedosphaera parvula]|uniref:tRNA N6-adenosine threonylcarbamoyltransferase n=1 Tax=Pedosphaera parvula (strain Ellin514) TaxID=320771 RepID=B9XP92_PEDPL|nr:tRNA (adenosine(37)-N6)-threonylcarbamoyltransferase complex transferase subunit TsaD [Pedosphaera parvula]EEF58343.1 metalloendopeptidase, glycoprotease family [Pedosphaera parvula Ellin514]